MKKNDKTIFIISLLMIGLSLTCDKSIDPIIQKDPRTYTWTIDTLEYPGSSQTMLTKIWGSSQTNVYAVGHNDRSKGNMYHFRKGIRWMSEDLQETEAGTIRGVYDFSDIYGFSWNDIWAVGDRDHRNPYPPPNYFFSSFIIHYDGTQWKETIIEDGKINHNDFFSIWGSATNNIYTCGRNKYIWHYDGIEWVKDSIPVNYPVKGEDIYLRSLTGDKSGNVQLIADYYFNNCYRYYFLKNMNNKWSIVDSFIIDNMQRESKWGFLGLWTSPEGTLYSYGPTIFRWSGSKWNRFFTIDDFDTFMAMGGSSDKNIFLTGTFGKVYHFNGIDWYQFDQFKNPLIEYYGIWTDGTEVFITGYTLTSPNKTIILHGK